MSERGGRWKESGIKSAGGRRVFSQETVFEWLSFNIHGNEYEAETVSVGFGVYSLRCPARQDVKARQPTRAGA